MTEMKKTGLLATLFLVTGSLLLQGQVQITDTTKLTDPLTWSGLDLVYKKDHIFDKKPIAYPYVREADVMWSKIVWRQIDLREKMNQALYFPTEPIGGRLSLIDALLEAINKGGLQAYRADDDLNEFKEPMTYQDVLGEFEAQDLVTEVFNVETNRYDTTFIKGEIRTSEVEQILIKEMWFFDRKRSVLDVRIIGLCPIRFLAAVGDSTQENLNRKKLFWVKYPEARPFLAQKETFNSFNDAELRSYDEIFYKRFFDGFIVQESNVYNNRMIRDYTVGTENLLEAERIENLIFQFEHDLWEY
jgi:gliding motility associated protien GldN